MKRILAAGAAMIGAGLAAVGLSEEKAAVAENQAAPRNPKPKKKAAKAKSGWKRTTGGGRGWSPMRKLAADPDPMTRQVRRQNERRSVKQPLGVRQAEWHRQLGLPVSAKMKARG